MPQITMDVSQAEKEWLERYAKEQGITPAQAVRNAFLELLEDELDSEAAEQAYQEWVDSGQKSRPIAELWRECDGIQS